MSHTPSVLGELTDLNSYYRPTKRTPVTHGKLEDIYGDVWVQWIEPFGPDNEPVYLSCHRLPLKARQHQVL